MYNLKTIARVYIHTRYKFNRRKKSRFYLL